MIGNSGSGLLALVTALTDGEPVGDGALSTRAHVLIVITVLVSIAFIVRLVRRQQLRSKYSLLWIVVAIALGTVAVFPGLLDRVSRAAGVYYPPATFLFLAVGFLFLVVVHFSWEFSRSEERIRTLAEDLALLQASHDAAIDALREGELPPERAGTAPLDTDPLDTDSLDTDPPNADGSEPQR